MVRSAEGLLAAAHVLASVRTDAHLAPGGPAGTSTGLLPVVAAPQAAEWETTNVHQVASVLTATALERTESRGGHFRSDYPVRDPAWLQRLEVQLDADGRLVTRRVTVGA